MDIIPILNNSCAYYHAFSKFDMRKMYRMDIMFKDLCTKIQLHLWWRGWAGGDDGREEWW